MVSKWLNLLSKFLATSNWWKSPVSSSWCVYCSTSADTYNEWMVDKEAVNAAEEDWLQPPDRLQTAETTTCGHHRHTVHSLNQQHVCLSVCLSVVVSYEHGLTTAVCLPQNNTTSVHTFYTPLRSTYYVCCCYTVNYDTRTRPRYLTLYLPYIFAYKSQNLR